MFNLDHVNQLIVCLHYVNDNLFCVLSFTADGHMILSSFTL